MTYCKQLSINSDLFIDQKKLTNLNFRLLFLKKKKLICSID